MQTFEQALQQAGYPLPQETIRDGNIHRFGEKNRCWYVANADFGMAGDWKEERQRVTWQANAQFKLSQEDRRTLREKVQARKQEYEQEEAEKHEKAAQEAGRIFADADTTGHSAYLARKQAQAHGIRFGRDPDPHILIPLRDAAGNLWSFQKIYDDGVKRFLQGGRKKGCFHVLGELSVHSHAYLCEGYATGATIHEATGWPVVVCFDAGNLLPVLQSLAAIYPVNGWVIAADNDAYGQVNTGRQKAEEAAKALGCRVVLPAFKHSSGNPTDFNDLAVAEGVEEVGKQLATPQQKKVLKALTLHDFLGLEIPPREMLLSPIIPSQGLAMLYAIRGIGKTYVSLSIALAVATGSAMLGERWSAEKPRRVLFVDGEMAAVSMQERLAALASNMTAEMPSPDYLRIVTPDLQERGVPDLATEEGKQAIEEHLQGVELLVLDNLSSLLRQGKENEAESWMPLQSWLLSLRTRGIAVLVVHHANKGGGQRGTSKKEDLLDTVIALRRAQSYDPQHGAQFEVHYEKARGFHGKDAEPFEARLVQHENSLQWEVKDLEDSLADQVQVLKGEGLTQREIAKELNCSAAKVNRVLKKTKGEKS